MGKQILDRTKKILGISLIILFVMSMGVAVVSAQPQQGGQGYAPGGGQGYEPGGYGGGGGFKNCHWVCDHWHRQRFCDHGHWVFEYGRRFWRCDHWSWRWICDHWSWKCFGKGY